MANLINHVAAGSTDTNNVTTASINCTGANFLVACCTSASAHAGTISDSQSNTWTSLTRTVSGNATDIQLFYVFNASVSASHTFTISSTGGFPCIEVMAWSGIQTTPNPFDVQNTNSSASATSLTPGSITPSVNNELIVVGLAVDTATSATSIDSNFTITDTVTLVGGQHFGGSIAYLLQGTAAAVNPTWSWTTAALPEAAIASFKSTVGPTPAQLTPVFTQASSSPGWYSSYV